MWYKTSSKCVVSKYYENDKSCRELHNGYTSQVRRSWVSAESLNTPGSGVLDFWLVGVSFFNICDKWNIWGFFVGIVNDNLKILK